MRKMLFQRVILGEQGKYSLEHRLIISASAIAVIIAFTGAIINFYFDFSVPAFIIPVILLVCSSMIYYYARFRNEYRVFVIPMTIVVSLGLGLLWIFNGGMDGPNIIIFFIALVLALIINKPGHKFGVFVFYLLSMISLYAVQYFHPQWIVPYTNENERLIDNLVTIIYISFLVYLVVSFLHREYTYEHDDAKLKGEKLKLLNKQLQEYNATKDKFFSIIAHDLKNPVFNMSKLSEMLYDDFGEIDETEKKDLIKVLKSSSKNILNLLENLLLWARSQQGKINLSKVSTDITRLININISLMELQASNKNIVVHTEFAKNNIAVFDENLINTVIRNLLSNALKYTPNFGEVTIRTFNTGHTNKITVSIEDTGVGMLEETMAKLFRIESAMSNPGTNSEQGTGLGLILCKEFVEMNGGTIGVESKLNNGSKFWFTLPKSMNYTEF